MAGGPLFRVEVFSPRSFSSIRTQLHVDLFVLKIFYKSNAISIVIYTIENKFVNGFPENKKKRTRVSLYQFHTKRRGRGLRHSKNFVQSINKIYDNQFRNNHL